MGLIRLLNASIQVTRIDDVTHLLLYLYTYVVSEKTGISNDDTLEKK